MRRLLAGLAALVAVLGLSQCGPERTPQEWAALEAAERFKFDTGEEHRFGTFIYRLQHKQTGQCWVMAVQYGHSAMSPADPKVCED